MDSVKMPSHRKDSVLVNWTSIRKQNINCHQRVGLFVYKIRTHPYPSRQTTVVPWAAISNIDRRKKETIVSIREGISVFDGSLRPLGCQRMARTLWMTGSASTHVTWVRDVFEWTQLASWTLLFWDKDNDWCAWFFSKGPKPWTFQGTSTPPYWHLWSAKLTVTRVGNSEWI